MDGSDVGSFGKPMENRRLPLAAVCSSLMSDTEKLAVARVAV